jgi:hypothetical protein
VYVVIIDIEKASSPKLQNLLLTDLDQNETECIARSNEILGCEGVEMLETVNCCAFLKRRLIRAC